MSDRYRTPQPLPTVTLEQALRWSRTAVEELPAHQRQGRTIPVPAETLYALAFYAEEYAAPAVRREKGKPSDIPEGYFWGSCTVEDDWDVGRYRHIIRRGGIDTSCGATASFPEVWVAGHAKPKCTKCLDAMSFGKTT